MLRKKFIVVLMVLLASAQTYSQEFKTKSKSEVVADLVLRNLKQDLSLNDQQEREIYSIGIRYADKIFEWEESDLSKQQRIIAHRADGQALDRELKAVLNPDQFQFYLAKRESMIRDLSTYLKRLGVSF